MTVEPALDPAVADALTRAVGHPAPHTDAELAAVADLVVVHPNDLAGLARCTGLRRLTLVAGDVAVPRLAGLVHVRIVACRIASLAGLLDAPGLRRRDLLFSAAPSLAGNDDEVLAAAAGGTVAGVPHSRTVAEYRAELTDDASEYERRQCVRLWERTGAVFGAGVLVRPGPPALTGNAFDAVRLSAADLERALDEPGFTLESLFQRYPPMPAEIPALLARVAQPPGGPLRRWAAAAELWPDDRYGAERFALRYPRAGLRTDPRGVLDAAAALYRELVPAPFLLRPKLAKWLLLRATPALCLGRFPGRAWLLGLPLDPPAPDDVLLALGYLIVGRDADRPGDVLAVTVDDAECIVRLDLDAALETLAGRPSPFPALRRGGDPPRLAGAEYRGYRELLDDVTTTRPAPRVPASPPPTARAVLPRGVRLELRRLRIVYSGRSIVDTGRELTVAASGRRLPLSSVREAVAGSDPRRAAELLAGVVSRPGPA
ncbi:hypothetical protein [Dactylosporangium sp. CA-233914]|uniref:hypothetical protein n=1 Tax=Dactylosporangium sp. CA-233914 TaxID=3239934 RepID=UPI003D8C6B63